MVRLFEPAMLLLMGGLVMLIVLAILLPILSMNKLVSIAMNRNTVERMRPASR